MIRFRNALSKLIRVGRNRATAPDSIPPFIRLLRSNHVPIAVPYSLTGLRSMTERAGGGDATRRIA